MVQLMKIGIFSPSEKDRVHCQHFCSSSMVGRRQDRRCTGSCVYDTFHTVVARDESVTIALIDQMRSDWSARFKAAVHDHANK